MGSNVVALRRPPKTNHVLPGAARTSAWLRLAKSHTDLSWEQLCRQAGFSPTTITRFMMHGMPVPKLTTLAKIAKVVGMPEPDLALVYDSAPFINLPLVDPATYRSKGLYAAMQESLNTLRAPARYATCVGVKITADTASLAGILLGDIVLAEPATVFRLNDLVVVALETGTAGVYRVQGPWLVPQSPGQLAALPLADASIIGIARQVQRELS